MSNKDKQPAISLQNVSKVYHTYESPRHRLLELLSGGRKQYARETRALDQISFSMQPGARLGIVGENGSGKSTLLKVLAGVLTPSSGKVAVNGRVSALLELGAGFNPEIAGRENIRQFCMLHGMERDEIDMALPEIIQFSELRDAVDQPVKTYSSGMAVRLGFACAVYVQPDILIVDEALSVGDAYFQNKCLHKIKSMLDQGTSFIYVTHAADAIRSLCNEGLWLENGKVRVSGTASEVGAAYQSHIFGRMVRGGLALPGVQDQAVSTPMTKNAAAESARIEHLVLDETRRKAFSERVGPLRSGSGEILIEDINVIDHQGTDTDSVDFDEQLKIRVLYRVQGPAPAKAVLNVAITDDAGRQIVHLNPMFAGLYASDAPPHVLQMIEFTFKNPLCPGEYGVTAGIATLYDNPKNHGQTLVDHVVDYCPGASRFAVRFPDHPVNRDLWGIVHVDYEAFAYSLD
jgi:lipopolysaccharide transport system ATP-binding protein